jgi:polygalacturonase
MLRLYDDRRGAPALLIAIAVALCMSIGPANRSIAATAAPVGEQVSPADFGFPVPNPEPPLPEGADAFDPPSFPRREAAPLIAEHARTADRDQIVTMTGVELDGETRFAVFAQDGAAETGSVRSIPTLRADKTAASLLLPASLPPWSMYLLWPQRGERYGAPVAVNRTEAWWIGPDNAAPGAVLSVFGRNLARANGTTSSFVYIKPQSGAGRYVETAAVNPFKVDVRLPQLAPGAYEVWIHNGHGGRFGWSGPLALTVLARSPWAAQADTVLEVTRFGAKGDGVADDTDAIRTALAAAAARAPATLHFPAGRYLVSAPLEAPDNVRWLGEGMDQTKIELNALLNGSLIDGGDENARFEALTLDANENTGKHPLLWIPGVSNFSLEAVRIKAWNAPALETRDSRGIFINGSELIENGSFYGNSRQIFMTGNRFRMTGYGESVAALWGGADFAMVGNDLANADESRDDGHGIGRFFVAQGHHGSLRNLYWGGNVSHDAAPHDCAKVDCNKGEQICFEMASGGLLDGFTGAGETTASFPPSAIGPSAVGWDLVIVGGRGAGQRRSITAVRQGTAILETPWKVVPDASSRFALAGAAYRAAIYGNRFEGRASYSAHDSNSTAVLLYGNVYDMVVDSNQVRQMRHGLMTVALASTGGMSPYFLQYSNNTVTDSNSGLYVGTSFAEAGVAGIWGGLGHIYRNNRFERLAHIGVEYESWTYDGADFNATVFEGNRFKDLPFGFIDAFQLLWTYDGAFKAPPPQSSRKYNTVLYRNSFERGAVPLAGSVGFVSRQPENTWLNMDSTWTGFAAGNTGP